MCMILRFITSSLVVDKVTNISCFTNSAGARHTHTRRRTGGYMYMYMYVLYMFPAYYYEYVMIVVIKKNIHAYEAGMGTCDSGM